MQAEAEDTLDPSKLSTRRVESMSDIVAEMVLGACDGSESEAAALADAAALAAARKISVPPDAPLAPIAPLAPMALAPPPSFSPPPSLPPHLDVDLDRIPDFRPARSRVLVATFAALAVVASAVFALVTSR